MRQRGREGQREASHTFLAYLNIVFLPLWATFGLSDSLTVHGYWEPLHVGQGSISLEYQTYTSAYPFDILETGMAKPSCGLVVRKL